MGWQHDAHLDHVVNTTNRAAHILQGPVRNHQHDFLAAFVFRSWPHSSCRGPGVLRPFAQFLGTLDDRGWPRCPKLPRTARSSRRASSWTPRRQRSNSCPRWTLTGYATSRPSLLCLPYCLWQSAGWPPRHAWVLRLPCKGRSGLSLGLTRIKLRLLDVLP